MFKKMMKIAVAVILVSVSLSSVSYARGGDGGGDCFDACGNDIYTGEPVTDNDQDDLSKKEPSLEARKKQCDLNADLLIGKVCYSGKL